jgi:hypothetical protein
MRRSGWWIVGGAAAIAGSAALAKTEWIPGYSAWWGIFPTTAAGFRGRVALMQAYLDHHPPTPGVVTAANALAYQLADDLAGTNFGYAVAGLQHTIRNGVVTNTPLPVPAGATVAYYQMVETPTNPYNPAQALIGKYVTPPGGTQVLWQVFPQQLTA